MSSDEDKEYEVESAKDDSAAALQLAELRDGIEWARQPFKDFWALQDSITGGSKAALAAHRAAEAATGHWSVFKEAHDAAERLTGYSKVFNDAYSVANIKAAYGVAENIKAASFAKAVGLDGIHEIATGGKAAAELTRIQEMAERAVGMSGRNALKASLGWEGLAGIAKVGDAIAAFRNLYKADAAGIMAGTAAKALGLSDRFDTPSFRAMQRLNASLLPSSAIFGGRPEFFGNALAFGNAARAAVAATRRLDLVGALSEEDQETATALAEAVDGPETDNVGELSPAIQAALEAVAERISEKLSAQLSSALYDTWSRLQREQEDSSSVQHNRATQERTYLLTRWALIVTIIGIIVSAIGAIPGWVQMLQGTAGAGTAKREAEVQHLLDRLAAKTARVVTAKTRMRAKPRKGSHTMMVLQPGDAVLVVLLHKRWAYVLTDVGGIQRRGWVLKHHVARP